MYSLTRNMKEQRNPVAPHYPNILYIMYHNSFPNECINYKNIDYIQLYIIIYMNMRVIISNYVIQN